jgi:hypothetical protein
MTGNQYFGKYRKTKFASLNVLTITYGDIMGIIKSRSTWIVENYLAFAIQQ